MLLLLVLTLQLPLCTAFRIDIVDDRDTGLIHNEVNVSCVSNLTWEVMVMELAKENQKPLVILRQHSDMTFGDGMKRNFKAEGRIYQNGTSTDYLKLTLANPGLGDLGRYICIMYHVNELGDLTESRASAEITIENLSFMRDLQYLRSRVSHLLDTVLVQNDTIHQQHSQIDVQNKFNSQQKDTINQQEKRLKDLTTLIKEQKNKANDQERQIDDLNSALDDLRHQIQKQTTSITDLVHQIQHDNTTLTEIDHQLQNQTNKFTDLGHQLKKSFENQQTQITAFSSRVHRMEEASNTHSQSIQELQEKDQVCAFEAYYDSRDSFKLKDVLRFRQVDANICNAYNPRTGVFTAPSKGLYALHLTVLTSGKGKHVDVSIQANGRDVGRLFAKDDVTYDQSTISITLRLEMGDSVKPVVFATNANVLYGYHYSVFSGYLVKSL